MQINGEENIHEAPAGPVIFKKHGFVPKQTPVEVDLALRMPELLPFFEVLPGADKMKTAQDVKLEFMIQTKRLWADHGIKVAFREPIGRGKTRLVSVGPRGGQKTIGAGNNIYEAVLDATAKHGEKVKK
jgi:hypothetical protein